MIKVIIALALALLALAFIGYVGVFIAFALVDAIKRDR